MMEKGIRNTLPRPCRGCCSGLCHGDAGIGAGRQYGRSRDNDARGSCQFSLAVPKRTGAPAKGGARVVRKNAPPYGALCAKPSSLKGSRYLARTGCAKYVPNHFAIWRTHEVAPGRLSELGHVLAAGVLRMRQQSSAISAGGGDSSLAISAAKSVSRPRAQARIGGR